MHEPAPRAVTDKLTEFGAEVWSLGLELANARLAVEHAKLETARVQIEAEKAEVAEWLTISVRNWKPQKHGLPR